MSEQNVKPSSSPRRSLGRKLLWAVGLLVVLLVIVFFVVTSGAFIKGVILPKAGAGMNADITAGEIELSPFSQLVLHDLKVTPKGGEPLLTASLVRARYSLFSIIGGKIVVPEITVESPVITLVENADGTSNLDPVTKNSAAKSPPAPAAKSSTPPTIDIKSVALKNATVRRTKNLKGGGHEVTEISNVNFTVADLKNGSSGKLDLSAAIALDNTAPAGAGNLQAKLNGAFTFDLTQDLKPGKVNGKISFTVENAKGIYADLAALSAEMNCEASATEVKQMALTFARSGQTLGEIRVNGPMDAAKSEGKLNVAILSLDKRVLNLAGAASGIDFGTTVINSTNLIELTQGGAVITASGQLDAAHVRVTTRQGQTTPTLDLRCDYAVTLDNKAKTALLQKLDLSGAQDAKPFLQGGLSSPMTVSLGGAAGSVGDAAFNLTVNDLNLEAWRAFAADLVPAGLVNLKVKILSQQGGKALAFDLDGGVTGLEAKAGAQKISRTDVKLAAHGSAASGAGANLNQIKLTDYRLEVLPQGQSAVIVSGSGTLDSATQEADLQVAVQATLARLLVLFPQPGLTVDSGTVELKSHVTKKQQDQSVTAKITLAGLTGVSGKNHFANLGATVDLDAGLKAQQLEIRQGQLTLTPTDRAKNELRLTGSVNLSKSNAISGNLKLAADALDVTHFYDVMQGNTNAAAPAAQAQAAPSDNKEPDAVKLPVGHFTFEVSVGHFYLREVDAANFQLVAQVDGSHVVLKPAQLTLNQAPINATVDLDLSVPGYIYDVAFTADKIPLAPLVNSFAPDRKGQISGFTTAGAQIKGAGVTGINLQKNLVGQFNFLSTNMNLSLTNVRSPMISSVINTVVGLPDLIRNPTAILGNLLNKNSSAPKTGFTDQLTAAPIDVIQMKAQAGSGKIQLQQTEVRSQALQILATGEIAIAPILTNSTIQIPVSVTLSRSLADKIGLVNKDTPTNAVYVALPDFLKLKGTVGKPDKDINTLALLTFAAKSAGGVGKQSGGAVADKASSLLDSVGGLFGGKKSVPSAPVAKPAPVKKP